MAENEEPAKKRGLLSLYLNETLANPQFPRLLSWVGRIKKELDERVVECAFVSAKGERITLPFSPDNFPIDRRHERFAERNIRISVAPFLRIGTLWKDGAEMSDHNHAQYKKRVLRIEKPLADKPMQFYTTPTFKSFEKQFPFPNNIAAKSFVLSFRDVKIAGGSEAPVLDVTIPCYEIARFYFFNSSTATRAVLTPGSLHPSSNKFFKPEDHIVPVSGTSVLTMPKIVLRIPTKTDRLVTARIAFSSEARQSVSMIQASVLDKGNYGYIKATFPFSTPTDLEVLGIEITDPNGAIKSFLVLEILSCTGQFPFDGFEYSYDWQITEPSSEPPADDSDPKDKEKGAGHEGKTPGNPVPPTTDPPSPTSNGPGYLGGRIYIGRIAGTRFKSAPREEKLEYVKPKVETGGNKRPPWNYSPHGYSDKEHNSENAAQPKLEARTIDDPDTLKHNQERFEKFNLICQGIADMSGMDVSFLTNELSVDNRNFYPILNEPYKYFSWCYNAKDKPREYSLAHIAYLGETHFYIIEHSERHGEEKIGMRVIRKKSAKHRPGIYEMISNFEWDAILTSFGRNHGKLTGLKSTYEVFSLYHTENASIERMIKTIIKRAEIT